jgi:hypothetical protein
LAFTLYAANRPVGVPSSHGLEMVNGLIEQIISLGSNFMVIFVCRPDRDWPAPEVPSLEARGFALTINEYINEAKALWRAEITELPWSLERRLFDLTKVITKTR